MLDFWHVPGQNAYPEYHVRQSRERIKFVVFQAGFNPKGMFLRHPAIKNTPPDARNISENPRPRYMRTFEGSSHTTRKKKTRFRRELHPKCNSGIFLSDYEELNFFTAGIAIPWATLVMSKTATVRSERVRV